MTLSALTMLAAADAWGLPGPREPEGGAASGPLFVEGDTIPISTNRSIALGRLDGDNRLDLVAAWHGGTIFSPGGIRVFLGDGSDGFTESAPLAEAEGFRVDRVELADLDNDGRDDLIATDGRIDELLIWLNSPSGLGVMSRFPVDSAGPLALGLLDGDDLLDIALLDAGAVQVRVLFGSSDWASPTSITLDANPTGAPVVWAREIAAGDVTGDGLADLLVANARLNSLTLIGGMGAQSFAPAIDLPLRRSLRAIASLGPNVVVAANVGADDCMIMEIQTSDQYVGIETFPTGGGPCAIATGDLDNDGAPDVIVVNAATDDVSVLMSDLPFGHFTLKPETRFGVGQTPADLAIGDLNADGNLDAVVANAASDDVSVLMGDGTGALVEIGRVGVGSGPVAVALADTDLDMIPDLIVVNRGSADVSVVEGLGDGTFGDEVRLGVGADPCALCVADFDADAFPDLVIANTGSDDLSLLFHDEDGAWLPQMRLTGIDRPIDVVTYEMDADNTRDIGVLSGSGAQLDVLVSNADTTFAQHQHVELEPGHVAIGAGFLNNRGRPNLLVIGAPDDYFTALEADQDLRFVTPLRLNAGYGPSTVTIADFNDDRRADVLFTGPSILGVLPSNADGGFDSLRVIGRHQAIIGRPVCADLDHDGDQDIAVALARDGFGVQRAVQPGVFGPLEVYPAGEIQGIKTADIDNDSCLDLIGRDLGTVSVFLNTSGPPETCPCDWNEDAFLNDTDFFDWLNDYFGGVGPVGSHDFNDDGFENEQDWFDFTNCFFTPPAPCE